MQKYLIFSVYVQYSLFCHTWVVKNKYQLHLTLYTHTHHPKSTHNTMLTASDREKYDWHTIS